VTRVTALVLALLTAATVAAAVSSAGQAPSVSYSRRVWQSAEGLPEDLAQAVAETQDGYLWIGTSGGLVRFDGVRFTVFNHENEPAFQDDSIYSLFVTRDGTLWAGTEGGGLIRFAGGAFRRFGAQEGLANAFVRVIYQDRRGSLWVGTDSGLFEMTGDSFVRVDGRDGLPAINIHSICEDRAGRLLVGGWGLIVIDRRQKAYFSSRESMADNSIRTIRQTADGAVWMGTISGLRRLAEGVRGDPFAQPKMVTGSNVSALVEGRGGELWIGTYGRGLMRYERGRLEGFSAPTSLPHSNVLALFEDSEQNVWVGTHGGLLRLSRCAASTVTTSDGAPLSINTIYQDPQGDLLVAALNGRLLRVSDQTLTPATPPGVAPDLPIRNVFRDSRGRLWLGTDGQGVVRLSGRVVTRYTMNEGLASDFVRAFCEDRDGGIWIGTDGGLSHWRNDVVQSYKLAYPQLGNPWVVLERAAARLSAPSGAAGPVFGSIRGLLLDRAGRLWVATDVGLSRFERGAAAADPLLDRLRGLKVWALHEDAEGGLWIGTQGAGLLLLKNRKLTAFTTRQGLPSDKVHFIAEDQSGHLWMSGPAGIAAVSRSQLEDLARNPSGQLAVRVYTTVEGLSTNQMTGGVQPAGALTPTGELWFPSTKGAVRIKPDLPEREAAPRVLIEQVVADDRAVASSGAVRLPPGGGKLEIHYTAIRLRSPERIRFRYRLEGFEEGWTAAGQRRVAYYTNLPAGRYRFHVTAYELNAPENAAERALDIEWRPHFYQTAWFLVLCVVVALATAWGSYLMHVRNLHRRFAAVLDERTRLAREMHDTLIQGCVGVSTLLEAAAQAKNVSPQLGGELLDRARTEVRATVDEARLAIWDLRHGADGADLAQAVARLVERVREETGVPTRFESTGTPLAVGEEVQRSLMLLVREALHNALRHAAPKQLSVRLAFDRQCVRVEVQDDGCGFDPAAPPSQGGHHYGLIGMRERIEKLGGRFCIESAPGSGTKVRLSIPVARSTPVAARPD
jgi:ligand-binding sensor domain-containing protein/signal transduction histidine kinase